MVMFMASCYGYTNVVKLLVAIGAYSNESINDALCRASCRGHLDLVKYLISIGADVKHDYHYSLYHAAFNGHLEVVKCLVLVGIDDIYIHRGIEYAIRKNNLNVVKYLATISNTIKLGVINGIPIRDYPGFVVSEYARMNCFSALRCAYQKDREDIIRYLLSIGCYDEFLDLYNYINLLDSRHLEWIVDIQIRKIIIAREDQKRSMYNDTQYTDIMIWTID